MMEQKFLNEDIPNSPKLGSYLKYLVAFIYAQVSKMRSPGPK